MCHYLFIIPPPHAAGLHLTPWESKRQGTTFLLSALCFHVSPAWKALLDELLLEVQFPAHLPGLCPNKPAAYLVSRTCYWGLEGTLTTLHSYLISSGQEIVTQMSTLCHLPLQADLLQS
jgi:hypothetical protein